MPLTIVDRNGLLTEELREFAERRLVFALSRFDAVIRRVQVVVEDANGPRGGIDKSCLITVSLRRANDVVVSDQDADLNTCLARGADRVGRAVARAVERGQHFERVGRRAADFGQPS